MLSSLIFVDERYDLIIIYFLWIFRTRNKNVWFHIYPKYSDIKTCTNSVDPDQTPQYMVYTVSACPAVIR